MEVSMAAKDGTGTGPQGMVQLRSFDSTDATYARLKSAVVSRGLTIFAEIDFAHDAAAVGLSMRPTRLLVFGNPRAGTPLMEESPTVALDLPLKILVWTAHDEATWVGYNTPEYLGTRHGLPDSLLQNLQGVKVLAELAATSGTE
jgi:uncharacterized protein (DUF302 family)